MDYIVFWIVFSVIVGAAAHWRGRNGAAWFFLSVLISPLLSVILVLVLPALPTADTHRRCPECAEVVLKDARRCKHCGSKLELVSDPAGQAGFS